MGWQTETMDNQAALACSSTPTLGLTGVGSGCMLTWPPRRWLGKGRLDMESLSSIVFLELPARQPCYRQQVREERMVLSTGKKEDLVKGTARKQELSENCLFRKWLTSLGWGNAT